MILGGKPPGKVGRRRNQYHKGESLCDRYSSLAQLAEHAAVNRVVVGSSPTGGAKKAEPKRYNVDLVSNREGLRVFRKPSFVIKT